MSKKPPMNADMRESEGHEQESERVSTHSRPFPTEAQLFDRVVTILEQARSNVVRAVNTNMVLAYWLIGREIVEEVQGGKDRAEYGEKMVENLSARLTERYGNGFSLTTLQYFRKFYLAYPERCSAIPRPMGVESSKRGKTHPIEAEVTDSEKYSPLGEELSRGFSPQLSWSHYRACQNSLEMSPR